jgi:replicative DNA helicase
VKAEDALLSAVLRGAGTRNAMKLGVNRDLFLTRRAEWIWLERNPDVGKVAFKARFPDFKIYAADPSDLEAIVRQVQSDRAYHEVGKVFLQSQRLFGQMDPLELTRETTKKLETILSKYGRGEDRDIFSDTTTIFETTRQRKIARRTGKLIGWPFGVPTLDEMFGGMMAPDLITIVARQGEMKTWLSLYFATQALVAGAKPMYVSLEMGTEQVEWRIHTLLSRLLSQAYADKFRTVFSNRALMMGTVNMKQYRRWLLDAKKQVKKGFIIPSSNDSQSVEQIRGKMEQHHPDLLFYDYFGLAVGEGRVENWMEAEQASHGFKAIAKEYGIPIILNAQASRKAADDKDNPKLEHIAYTDAIGRDSDRVLTLRVKRGELNAYIAKNRFGPSDRMIRFDTDIDKGVLDEIVLPGRRSRYSAEERD